MDFHVLSREERRDWIHDAPFFVDVLEALEACSREELRELSSEFDLAAQVAGMNGERDEQRRWRFAYHAVGLSANAPGGK